MKKKTIGVPSFLAILAIVAGVELLVMLILSLVGVQEGASKNLIEAVLLLAISVPLLYAFEVTILRKTRIKIQLQAAALESAANSVVITDRAGNIVWTNPAFTVVTGYSSEEVLGQNPRILSSDKHPRSFYDSMWKTILAGQVWSGEIINRRKDGQFYTEEQTITPVRNDRGEITHFIAIKQDISEKKHLEDQFRHAQKMEAVGRLSGGIAHDFNNLLGVIIGYSEILEEQLGEDSSLGKNAGEIKKAGMRAASLTRQLLAFSRQQVLDPKVLNINNILVDTEKMLCRLIGEDIELTTALAPELGQIKADQGQIEQIIMNLAVNARDAMPEGGKLIIETGNITLDKDYALTHLPTVPGNYVMLVVTDTGIGMDAQTQANIFEPFFTTKEIGKGTGLGLSTVYGIVKQSGGYVWVYSEPNIGSTFKIYLPRADELVSLNRPSDVAIGSLQGSETILLVEDEEALRVLTRALLEERGYTVLETNGGSQAIEIASQHRGPIHLLLTDMVMPGMTGLAVTKHLMPIRPDMKVIYMSGYTSFTSRALLDNGTVILPKPISREDLLFKVREVLNSPQESTLVTSSEL